MFERAHAMVLSWPYQLRTDEDVYEKLVGERPYMSVDGRPARTVACRSEWRARHLGGLRRELERK